MLTNKLMGASGEAQDPNFENVTLLLHGDGTNGAQNNTFLDSSPNNFTITRNGNTTQGSFSPYGDLWSNYFDGSGDYLTTSYTSAFEWSASDFTVEAWVYPTSLTGWSYNNAGYSHSTMVGNCTTGAVQATWSFGPLADGRIGFYYFNGAQNTVYSTLTIPANQWSHVAMTKTSAGIVLWVNGVGNTVTAISGTPYTDPYLISIGSGNAVQLAGYISNLRIVKGTAVYTSNFTPSTTPLTAISGTSLLTCQSNRFKDNSSNNFTITKYGDTKVTNFAPFVPDDAYDPAVNGGSGYFDGSGDYLSVPYSASLNVDSGAFTLEAWINPTSLVSAAYSNAIYDMDAYSRVAFSLVIDGATKYPVFLLSADNSSYAVFLTGSTPVQIGVWQHIAVCRSGSSIVMYLNGVSIGTASSSAAPYYSGITEINIGAVANGTGSPSDRFFNGYISNLRIVKGTAVYTSNFTPSTTPLTAISGTSLLCNFTNAGIYDNSMKNDLETVGNAQISTSVKKYGTGSMYFDGSGDYLSLPSSPNLAFGTGEFTVECWVWVQANAYNCILCIGQYPSSGTAVFRTNSTGQLQWYFGNASFLITSADTIPVQTWTHVAAVRSSGTTKLYINGVNSGSAADSNSYGTSLTTWIGAENQGSVQNQLTGYIDDLRITKGVARYTANFTPPTQAFPNQ